MNFFVKNLDNSRDIFYLRAGSNFQGGNVYGSITETKNCRCSVWYKVLNLISNIKSPVYWAFFFKEKNEFI
jgi:hypothetical protein